MTRIRAGKVILASHGTVRWALLTAHPPKNK
jgi:hypothetical protein